MMKQACMFTLKPASNDRNARSEVPHKLSLDLIKQLYLGKHVTLYVCVNDNPRTMIKVEGKLINIGKAFHSLTRELILKQGNRRIIVRGKGTNITTKHKVKL